MGFDYDIPVHPKADLFPMMKGDDWDRLIKSFEEIGQIDPIAVLTDGRLIDGRNRLKACKQLGLVPVVEVVDLDYTVGAYIYAANLAHRMLKPAQIAALAVKLSWDDEEAKSTARKAEGSSSKKRAQVDYSEGVKVSTKTCEPSERDPAAEQRARRTDQRVADQHGASVEYVRTAKDLRGIDADKFEELCDGTLSMADAKFIVAQRKNKKSKTNSDAELRRAKEWVGQIESVADYCNKVTVGGVRSNELLRQQWLEAIETARSALVALRKKLKGESC